MKSQPIWFLLFSGTSVDGRGTGKYSSRTTEESVALSHLKNECSSPYSTGSVHIVGDDSIYIVAGEEMFQHCLYLVKIRNEDTEPDSRVDSTEEPFFIFFEVEYYATGEGSTQYLGVERNCDKEALVRTAKERVGPFYSHGLTELSEEEFLTKWSQILPPNITRLIKEKSPSQLSYWQELHLNYS
ncbi:hypothetical protein SCBWM1_gp58 [Synechococcus phage S-CBWM1]|uniref:Uncharacterized protein n=1 Tax=Synechococcus phage S-CBWM1 TaxID=2053653 RepID=A0A3G1L3H9_9CAUD|nr:hypothetical protein HOU61_gp139 [Synechococcus phage S-CBWM1]ATW62742.1 hypothetical protein SCBWM1_gp58 [Synechococcus phage S-CBWM1]